MALPEPPSPLPALAKALFGNGLTPLWPWINLYDFWHNASAGGGNTWRRFRVRTIDITTELTADDAWWSVDVVNFTNGTIDDTWNDADYNAAIGAISEIAVAWLPYMWNTKKVTEISSYRMAFNPDYVVGQPGSNPFQETGPPERTYAQAHVGTATGVATAPQVSCTVTKQVASRKHWGRFYLPFPAASAISVDGQFLNAVADTMATVVHTQFQTLASAQLYPVVVQTQQGKVAAGALHQISGVQVDTNADVIRRRRAHTTRYRKTL